LVVSDSRKEKDPARPLVVPRLSGQLASFPPHSLTTAPYPSLLACVRPSRQGRLLPSFVSRLFHLLLSFVLSPTIFTLPFSVMLGCPFVSPFPPNFQGLNRPFRSTVYRLFPSSGRLWPALRFPTAGLWASLLYLPLPTAITPSPPALSSKKPGRRSFFRVEFFMSGSALHSLLCFFLAL